MLQVLRLPRPHLGPLWHYVRACCCCCCCCCISGVCGLSTWTEAFGLSSWHSFSKLSSCSASERRGPRQSLGASRAKQNMTMVMVMMLMMLVILVQVDNSQPWYVALAVLVCFSLFVQMAEAGSTQQALKYVVTSITLVGVAVTESRSF